MSICSKARVWRLIQLSTFLSILAASNVLADSTWVYTVQISATVQVSPPQITLSWQPDQYGANSYTVYRKSKEATSWGTGTTLPGTALSYADTDVLVGATYEYRIVKAATLGYSGYGYIYTGINAPVTDSRGKVILVATTSSPGLDMELARLQADLVGDGWCVIRHDVSSSDTPESVRNLIINDYNADPQNVNTVFLLGHVPVLQSGNLNYDGHLTRPMAADAYYADVDGDWGTSPSFLPSDAELMVGRVDFFNMPGSGAAVPWPNEVELLRRYLNKDHNWRHNLTPVRRVALMGARRGDEVEEATAASGYRNFEPFVGPGNTIEANTADDAPAAQRWISMLASNNYLWAYGCGAGLPTSISALGLADGTSYTVRTIDIVGEDAHAVFVMLFGSWFGNWDYSDDVMRSVLATPTMGLAACMAGRPHWFLHHMGLGETIGYGTRLSMNNSTLYQNQSNGFTRAIYIALMGDPTLRMEPVSPAANLTAVQTNGGVMLAWSASTEAAGYHVYRANNANGPFTRLTSAMLTSTSYADLFPLAGTCTYMVRAIKLQVNPSGSYYNPSQGIFTTISISPTPPRLLATRVDGTITLTWNSQPGLVYRVEAKSDPLTGNWLDVSGPINATSATTAWTEGASAANSGRFYRVVSP